MNVQSTPFTRRLALGALASAALMVSVPAMAEGQVLDVRIVNRDSGRTLPVYAFKGDLWVAGEPGARYAVQLTNRSRGRLLNVVSVDGVNVVSGATAAFDQEGYVLDAYQRYDVVGWRKNRREIAAFEFTRAPSSYAARTDRPDDVGVIGVAVFSEKQASWRENEDGRGAYGKSAPVPRSGAMPKSGSAGRSLQFDNNNGDAVEQALGTGHGERERDQVSLTDFERRSQRPDEIIRIRYDSHANLVKMGVIPSYRDRLRDREPAAFPAQRPRWVPDPR